MALAQAKVIPQGQIFVPVKARAADDRQFDKGVRRSMKNKHARR
jgi:hypothetical protein